MAEISSFEIKHPTKPAEAGMVERRRDVFEMLNNIEIIIGLQWIDA